MWKMILIAVAVTIWGSVTLISVSALYHTYQINVELRTQIDLLSQIRAVETERCESVYRVNAVCEKVVHGFATQLGLDTVAPSQILTTGIVKRHEGGIGGN